MKTPVLVSLAFQWVLVLSLVNGCARTPVANPPATPASLSAVDLAASMIGKPYRYGGATPQGFDCSGLVYYSFQRAGIDVPRSTERQRQHSRVVTSTPARGDLVFFNQEGRNSSHVGIVLGDNRFVHAPSSGKRVRVDSLNDPYWQKHLVDVRRF
mgnify:CR=1 FL=1